MMPMDATPTTSPIVNRYSISPTNTVVIASDCAVASCRVTTWAPSAQIAFCSSPASLAVSTPGAVFSSTRAPWGSASNAANAASDPTMPYTNGDETPPITRYLTGPDGAWRSMSAPVVLTVASTRLGSDAMACQASASDW